MELKRFYGFGLLPLVPGAPAEALSDAVSQLATQYPHIRGAIIGTRGVGRGLDDPALEPLWASLAETGLVVFLHPHYGIDAQAWGTRDNGHVLPLALGFPFETTTVCILHPSDDSLFYLLCYFTCYDRRLRVLYWRVFSIATQTCAFFSRTRAARFHSCHPALPHALNMIQSWRVGSHMMHDGILGNCGLMRLRTARLSSVLWARRLDVQVVTRMEAVPSGVGEKRARRGCSLERTTHSFHRWRRRGNGGAWWRTWRR